jgi:hypothetical protein
VTDSFFKCDKFFVTDDWSVPLESGVPLLCAAGTEDIAQTQQDTVKKIKAGGKNFEKIQWSMMDMRLQAIEAGGLEHVSRPIRARPVLFAKSMNIAMHAAHLAAHVDDNDE